MYDRVTFRGLRRRDLRAVLAVQRQAHGDALQEDARVFEARLGLASDAAWVAERGSLVVAYLLAHPWRGRIPPALNCVIEALPADCDTAYLHDLAVVPGERGSGVAMGLIECFDVWARSKDFARAMLVAVGAADTFWSRLGFERLPEDAAVEEKLSVYGAGAACMARVHVVEGAKS